MSLLVKPESLGLHLKKLGIDTYKEAVIYMREDCHVCLAEGFEIYARLKVTVGEKSIIATLNIITSNILEPGEAGLSNYAWNMLNAHDGDEVCVKHSNPVKSLSYVRSKIYGHDLSEKQLIAIIHDITAGRYSDIYIASFLTACAGGRINADEIVNLTKAMINVGDKLSWHSNIIVDKHCVGGLPGNRTTPIIVSIVAAFGLTMPKTSSRAITSPAGTADTMEVLAPVEIDMPTIKNIVGKENGCIIWGGSVSLSPSDDILIRVEKALNLDSDGQLVASVLSKKVAAGSTHVLIDIPIGATAKVHTLSNAEDLKKHFELVGMRLGIHVKVVFSDGSQPVGRGIGPALEARDIVSVLRNDKNAPSDLRERALILAGYIIEFSPNIKAGTGYDIASNILSSGEAWQKFQAICAAQGGMQAIPIAPFTKAYTAQTNGTITAINNRQLALVAKLAGAPSDKVAGIDLATPIGTQVSKGDLLFTIHAQSSGQLEYALSYLQEENDIIKIESINL